MLDSDRILGALLGTAVGDALGMPIDGLSHQNVRTYYKGIKGYRADEHRRDLDAGQWTAHTQRMFSLAEALRESDGRDATRRVSTPAMRRQKSEDMGTTANAATMAAPFGLFWTAYGRTWASGSDRNDATLASYREGMGTDYRGSALAAGFGQAVAVRRLLSHTPGDLDGAVFIQTIAEATRWAEERLGSEHAVSDRLRLLSDHLDDFPLDLQDLCDGTGPAADEAWPFAVAMVARNPLLLEATLLPAINVGGAASAIGACVGALVGALHGWAAFPAWAREGLEEVDRLEAEARAFAEALLNER
jgi:ADP-ribosylglycohydrolase